MAKWAGKIGFVNTEETSPGVWTEIVTERRYAGDIIRVSKGWQSTSEKINDDIKINNQISILADPYTTTHLSMIRYVEFMGTLWKVNDVTIEFPRLTLSIGGVYTGGQQN